MPLPFLGAALAGSSLGSKLVGGAAAALKLPPARMRSPAANLRIRKQNIDAAFAAAVAGEPSVTVTGIDGKRYTFTPPKRLLDEASTKWATEQARAYARERLAELPAAKRAGDKGQPKGAGASQSVGKSGTKGGKGTRRASRGRLYVRYDPDTGERVEVTRDDPRYDEWSNRKPRASSSGRSRASRSGSSSGGRSRRKTRAQKETDALVRRITNDAARAGISLTVSAAKKFAGMAAAAGMSTGAAAALVVGTGLAAYAATRWLINKIEDVTDPAYKREQVALAYRKARLDWERQEGRKLTTAEHKFLAENFKQALKALDAGVTYQP